MKRTENLRIDAKIPLVSPATLKAELPLTEDVATLVTHARATIERIIRGEDPRFMAIVGPCSIHDEQMAIEYAEKLAPLARQMADRLFIVMRVYFEKPRTTVGWKGLINDPLMDDSFQIHEGLRRARRILLRVGQLGLPAGTEMLEPITPQYIADLVSWASIGARTTESPTHRQMASGLSMPVGYKNSTDGTIDNAVNAMLSAQMPHHFLGVDEGGLTCIIRTKGNDAGHLILRGGKNGPNYDRDTVHTATELLRKEGLQVGVMIDCSHANSYKDYRRQEEVWRDVVAQHREDYHRIIGGMLESNLVEGKQNLGSDPSQLRHGVSITDGCIGWEQTETLLQWAYESITPPAVAV